MKRASLAVPFVSLAVFFSATSCASVAKGVGSAAIRTLVSQAGAAMFKDSGYPIEHELTCRGGTPTDGAYTVDCDGTTTRGQQVALHVTGQGTRANDRNHEQLHMVGSVEGRQLFDRTCHLSSC